MLCPPDLTINFQSFWLYVRTVLRGLLRPISFGKPPAPPRAAVPAFSSSPGMLPYLGPSPGAVHLVGGHLRKGWLRATHTPLRLVMTSGGHSEGPLSDPWPPAPAQGGGALSPVKAEHTEPGLAHGCQDLLSGRPELTPSPSPSQRVKSTAAPPTASSSGTQVDSADRRPHPACRL